MSRACTKLTACYQFARYCFVDAKGSRDGRSVKLQNQRCYRQLHTEQDVDVVREMRRLHHEEDSQYLIDSSANGTKKTVVFMDRIGDMWCIHRSWRLCLWPALSLLMFWSDRLRDEAAVWIPLRPSTPRVSKINSKTASRKMSNYVSHRTNRPLIWIDPLLLLICRSHGCIRVTVERI